MLRDLDYMLLSDAEVNLYLQYALGLKIIEELKALYLFDPELPNCYAEWDPCNDGNHMRLVRGELDKRNLRQHFISNLAENLGIDSDMVQCYNTGETWMLLNAPLQLQSRAALKTLLNLEAI